MKTELYKCDVCLREIGNEHKQEKTDPIQFKTTVSEPGKMPKEIRIDIIEPCYSCADRIASAMVDAGVKAMSNIKAAGRNPAFVPVKKQVKKKVDKRI